MYEEIKKEYKDLETKLSDPEIISNQNKLKEISKKHSEIKDAISMIFDLEKYEENIRENEEIMKDTNDKELIEMAKTETDYALV